MGHFKVLSRVEKERIVEFYQTTQLPCREFKAAIGYDKKLVYRILEEFGIPHKRPGGKYKFPQTADPNTKTCSKCGDEKPLTEYGLDNKREDKRHYTCKRCRLNAVLLRQYGITVEEYEAQFEKQKGLCACCGKPEREFINGVRKNLAVDHNHKTDTVRELLCRRCNVVLGFIETEIDVDLVASLQNYSKRHNLGG